MKAEKSARLGLRLVVALFVLATAPAASATGWETDGNGTRTHSLTSPDISFTVASADVGATCTREELHVDYVSTALLTVTGATFDGWHGNGRQRHGMQRGHEAD
jgi:hypothetical protein